MECFSILDLRGYREIEPMPEVPHPPKLWRDQMFWWTWCIVITFFLVRITHGGILAVWLPWWYRTIKHIRSNHRIFRQWDRDMKGYEARAMAHHVKIMGQLNQIQNRDWN